MDLTDIHLDTSWCPVCDCEIPPIRYQVLVKEQQQQQQQAQAAGSSNAVKASQTTRGKNGTIKARNGLVQGTGRMRPALNRSRSTKEGRLQQQQQQQTAQEPQRTRTVIDPSPTPLYCSEECRKRDMDEEWPVVVPEARDALDAPRRRSRARLGEHPSQINPALASPPSSPKVPDVPPNSYRVSKLAGKARATELDLDLLNACILEEAEELSFSDSSSATGRSFTDSDRSPVDERDIDWSHRSTDLVLPQPVQLPLHPHRPSAPVRPPGANRKDDGPKFEGGNLMASQRLQKLLSAVGDETATSKEERRYKEEEERKEEARLSRWDFTGEMQRKKSAERERKKQEEETLKKQITNWHAVVYNPSVSSPGYQPPPAPGIPSTHRRLSDTDPSKRIRAAVPSRTQSALEFNSKYPLFVSGSGKKSKVTGNKSSASIATSYAPAYGMTTSSSSTSVKSSSSSKKSHAPIPGASALTLPGADPVLYAGKKIAGARKPIGLELEGKLMLPDIMLGRKRSSISTSLPSGSGLQPPAPLSGPTVNGMTMRRSGSEANVSGRKAIRSPSVLGAVKEGEVEVGGEWHRPEEGSEDSCSTETRSTTEENESQTQSQGRRKEKKRASRSRFGLESETVWTEDRGPLYDVPVMTLTQVRREEIFVPDTPEGPDEEPYIAISDQYKGDEIHSRRELREIGRRRGELKGKGPGWWIEKEWEVKYTPARKRLFRFNGKKSEQSEYGY